MRETAKARTLARRRCGGFAGSNPGWPVLTARTRPRQSDESECAHRRRSRRRATGEPVGLDAGGLQEQARRTAPGTFPGL